MIISDTPESRGRLRVRAEFWNEGVGVFSNKLSEAITNSVKDQAAQLHFEPLVLNVMSNPVDEKRLQASMPEPFSDEMEAVHGRVEQLAQGFGFSWEVARSTWQAIKSEPGVEEQTIHRDFTGREIGLAFYRERCVQATVIVALMPDTKFIVYPDQFGGLVGRKSSVCVTLQPGDILFYRGDMVQSMAAYDELNICLRCFVRVWGVPQSENSSEIAAFASFLCSYCLQSFDTKEEAEEHEQDCTANPNTAELEEGDAVQKSGA